MRTSRVIVATVAAAVVSLGAAAAADYIGAAKCKICHKVQFDSWQTLGHAKAFERLKPEEQGNADCLRCHATGGSAEMPGVQCEACHGPGSGYKAMDVMKDRQKSAAAGLVLPDEALCKGCHAGKAPHDLPAFDFGTAKEKGVHAHKQAG
jgi:hypothetical protein